MVDIYLDEVIANEAITGTLARIFPDLTIHHYDFADEKPKTLDLAHPKHIFFNTLFDDGKIEFGFRISIYRVPGDQSTERHLFIGKKFSDINGIKVLVPYTMEEDPGNPYYDVIFSNGEAFLADDSNTSFGDGTDGLIKVRRLISLKLSEYHESDD